MIAEVIINSNVKTLNRTFDYLVPTELESKVKVGARIFVPFGNNKKLQEGFVIALKESSPYEVKPISKIEQGIIPENQVELAILMARRYFCNISDCIKLMLPPGTTGKKLENRAKDKMGQFVYLKKDWEDIENDIEEKIIKSPKQIRSLEVLKENEGIHILDLEALSDTTRAITKTLEKNGYIEIIEEKIERNPFEFKNIKRDIPLNLTEEQQVAYDAISESIDESRYEEFLLYGVTGSRKNRSILAINSKSIRARQICYYACTRNIINTTNGRPLFSQIRRLHISTS